MDHITNDTSLIGLCDVIPVAVGATLTLGPL